MAQMNTKGAPGFRGEQLRRAREAKGVNQDVLAAELGITRTYLSNLEHDRKAPSPSLLAAIASKLDIDAMSLLDTSRGVTVAHLRFAKGLSQGEVGERLGVSDSLYGRFERGAAELPITLRDTACAVLAELFGVPEETVRSAERRAVDEKSTGGHQR